MPFALKLIAANACPSSARPQFRFKFRRIPCALGRTRRDAQGNPTQEASSDSSHSTLAQSPATWSASYDRAGRLSALTKTSGSGHAQDSTTYQYDPNGNLTSSQRERAGTKTTRTYRTDPGHNKLLGFSQTSTSGTGSASTSVTHQYDAAGNLQSDGLHHYHYDSQGRLQSSQTGQGADAPTTRYAHNALGQRVFKTEPLFAAASGNGKQTHSTLDDEEEDPGLLQTLRDFFTQLWNPTKSEAEHLGWAYVYDEEGSLLGEYGMGGAQSAGQSQYLYLPTAQGPIPIAAEIDSRLYAIHTDHLGTPRRLTQADGQAAWQWAYTPYGDEAPTLGAKRFTNETTNPTTGSTNIAPVRFNLRYPGQYFDEESGLHYNYFRSYDPRTGRYTQSDPIGLDGGFNRFSYVGGNPLQLKDPSGLNSEMCFYPGFDQDWPHSFTCVNGNCAGWYPTDGKGDKSKGPWEGMLISDGAYFKDNDKVPKSYCTPIPNCDEKAMDQCMLQCRLNPPSSYSITDSNCFTAAKDCATQCTMKSCKSKKINILDLNP